MTRILLVFILLLSLFSCGESRMEKTMERIRTVSDSDTKAAARMMDSISVEVKSGTEYTRMRYDLLKIRIDDKNDVKPMSDKMIAYLVKYFEENGNNTDRQEAYFYAGSVYRDLNDTPRSIDYFQKSIDVMADSDRTDSLLMRNAYSNLYYLFYNVQDYKNALAMAEKEYALSLELRSLSVTTLMHLGNACLATDDEPKAMKCFDDVLRQVKQSGALQQGDIPYVLLYSYANSGRKEKAQECFGLTEKALPRRNDALACNARGEYYRLMGMTDDAIACYRTILKESKDEYNMYDAAKALFLLYTEKGDVAAANWCGKEFVRLTERLDLAQNQLRAATVNNRYQYHLDRESVLKTERERALYMNIAAYAALFAMVAAFTFVVVYMRKKNKALKMQLALNDRLNSMKTQLSDIREETKRKERMIEDVKADLADRETNLMNVGEELQRNEQLLADMKKRLADKMRQSETLMQMLQQAEMEDAAGDVVAAVRKSAEGKKKLSAGEWRQLISAVNSLHPDFKDLLLQRNEGLTEQQVQVCYLMRIGLTGPQINNVVDISRTTVWRWTQAYRWIYSIEDPN